MLDLPSRISTQVIYEMARRRFSLDEGLRRVRNKESIAITSDVNLASLRNIEDTNEGIDVSISELIATLRCRLTGVVRVQLWTTV